MNYLLKNSGRHREPLYRRPVGIVFITTLLIVLVSAIFPSFFPSIFLSIFASGWSSNSSQYADLEQRLAALEPVETRIAELTAENIDLKEILGRSIAKNTILSVVLRKPPQAPYDTLIIDTGKNNGVSVGDSVYALGNILIGRVAATYANYSKVKLFSNPGEKYEVLVGSHNIPATAVGRGGGSFEMILPRDSGVLVGDIVSVPSMTPSSLGVVSALVSEPAQAFVAVLIAAPVNMTQIRWVEVERESFVFDTIMNDEQ